MAHGACAVPTTVVYCVAGFPSFFTVSSVTSSLQHHHVLCSSLPCLSLLSASVCAAMPARQVYNRRHRPCAFLCRPLWRGRLGGHSVLVPVLCCLFYSCIAPMMRPSRVRPIPHSLPFSPAFQPPSPSHSAQAHQALLLTTRAPR